LFSIRDQKSKLNKTIDGFWGVLKSMLNGLHGLIF